MRIYIEIRPSYVMGGAEWCVTGAGAVLLCDLAAVLVCRCRVCVHRRGAGPLPGGALLPLRWCVSACVGVRATTTPTATLLDNHC